MFVKRYTCPSCGYVKMPANHRNCGGVIVKIGGTWVCDACGKEVNPQVICAKCGKTFEGCWTEEYLRM